MVYNPIFEEENTRGKELNELRKAIRLRAGKDQVKDLCQKFSGFVRSHPVFTTLAIGVFAIGLNTSKK